MLAGQIQMMFVPTSLPYTVSLQSKSCRSMLHTVPYAFSKMQRSLHNKHRSSSCAKQSGQIEPTPGPCWPACLILLASPRHFSLYDACQHNPHSGHKRRGAASKSQANSHNVHGYVVVAGIVIPPAKAISHMRFKT